MTKRHDGGDRDERFRFYYQRFYRRIVRYYVVAFRFSEEDAEELAQEAFLRFYEAMDEYRGDAEWAFFETVARNLAYNRIRYGRALKRAAKTVDIDDPDVKKNEPPAPAERDYGERQHDELRLRRMYSAIAELPPGQREAVCLWLRDFKYEEISRTLRITMDAVKSRIRDAKRFLRDRLGDTGLGEDGE